MAIYIIIQKYFQILQIKVADLAKSFENTQIHRNMHVLNPGLLQGRSISCLRVWQVIYDQHRECQI